MDSTASELDRISALPDDLLHLILASVGDDDDAAAVARTAVLSRRWRCVWLQSPDLSFADTAAGVPGQFASSVDRALDQRGHDADVRTLKIVCRHSRASPEQVNRWLRFAAQRVVKSCHLRLATTCCGSSPAQHEEAVVELPGHCRAASMRLEWLTHTRLRLPTASPAAKYEALTELTLHAAWFVGEEDDALGDFVSSCCPRLRKLDVARPRGLLRLVLRTGALEELRLTRARGLETLDVTAPNLRALSLRECFHVADIRGDLRGVRRLSGVRLDMHGRHCDDRHHGLWLLENCPCAEHVDLWLDEPDPNPYDDNDGMDGHEPVDFMAEGAAPFASVTSLVVETRQFYGRHFLAALSSLLLRLPCLRSLCISISGTETGDSRLGCLCDIDELDDHPNISLRSLEDVKISGFMGAEEEMGLLNLLFESSNSLKSMTVTAAATERMVVDNNDENEFQEQIDRELKKISCTNRGGCHSEGNVYTWCYPTQNGK